MKMNKIALAAALAAVGATGMAHADFTLGNEQNNLSLYGTLDLGFGTTNHSLSEDPNSASGNSAMANAAPNVNRLTSLLPSNTTPSKWGFKGQRTFNQDDKAGFVLESQVNVNTGTNPNGRVSDSLPGAGTMFNKGEGSIQGQMFDREASIWLSNSQYGLLKLGRMTTTLGDSMASYDPMAVGYAVSPLGMNGGWGAGAYTGDSRWDNSVKWSNSYGNWKAGLQYKFGGYTQGYTMGTAESAKLAYETPQFGLSFNIQNTLDSVSASSAAQTCTVAGGAACTLNVSAPALALTLANSRALGFFGRYNLNSQTVFKGGYEMIHLTNPSSASDYTTANVGQLSGLPVVSINTTPFSAYNSSYLDQTMLWGGVNYAATAKSTVSAAYYRRTDKYQSGEAGTVNYVSAKYEYALDKDTTLYATGVWSGASDNGSALAAHKIWYNATLGSVIPDTVTFTMGGVYRF